MKNVLVIGYSGGIGFSVTKSLLDNGYFVIGTSYNNGAKYELKASSIFKPVTLDISNRESITSLKKELDSELYAIVNCSGICKFEGSSLEKDFDIWRETIETNLSGNYYLSKIFFDKLQKNGRYIMISSTDSYYGGGITTSYAASKAGVNSLTKSLSLLFSSNKIRVNSIAPGWVETPMIEENGDEFLTKVAEINPLKRNAKPIDVANLVLFLLSEKSDYINGQVISLEGGYTNQDPTLLLEADIQE